MRAGGGSTERREEAAAGVRVWVHVCQPAPQLTERVGN